MKILTIVRRLYISFKSLVNDFVYSFGRAALLLLVEAQNHTVPVWERGRIRDKVIYCAKHVSLHTNQSRRCNTVLCVMSSYQLLHTAVILYVTRHEGSRLITFEVLELFGGVFKALILILTYHNVYVLTKIVIISQAIFGKISLRVQVRHLCHHKNRENVKYFDIQMTVHRDIFL